VPPQKRTSRIFTNEARRRDTSSEFPKRSHRLEEWVDFWCLIWNIIMWSE